MLASGPIPTFAARWGADTFANAGIKGRQQMQDSSGVQDLTFAFDAAAGWVANVKSTPLAPPV
jgi:hypothetical protein